VKEEKSMIYLKLKRDYYLENTLLLVTWFLEIASRAAKERCDAGFGVKQNRESSLFRLCCCNTTLRKRTSVSEYFADKQAY
jgi:hypothetical protein